MCELLESRTMSNNPPYDLEEPEDITKSLMILSERSLQDFLASEPDVYTVDDVNRKSKIFIDDDTDADLMNNAIREYYSTKINVPRKENYTMTREGQFV